MWQSRRWGAAALGRCVSREAAERCPDFVILRARQRPKDLRPASSKVILDTGAGDRTAVDGHWHFGLAGAAHRAGTSRQGYPEILHGLKAVQDDRARRIASRPEAGFTLIELLVVIAVIAILAGLVAPQVFSNVSDARATAARAQIENFVLALDAYRLDNHQYPSTEQGLAALMTRPDGEPVPANWRGPYLRRALPADPWGHPYIYRAPGDSVRNGYDLLTLGRDGKQGGTDEDQDITSWGPAR